MLIHISGYGKLMRISGNVLNKYNIILLMRKVLNKNIPFFSKKSMMKIVRNT